MLAETADTVKVPGPVNVWILKSPEVVSVPPVAEINSNKLPCSLFPLLTTIHPLVAST